MLKYSDIDRIRDELSGVIIKSLVKHLRSHYDVTVVKYGDLPPEYQEYNHSSSQYGYVIQHGNDAAILYNEDQPDDEIAITLLHEMVHLLNGDLDENGAEHVMRAEQHADIASRYIFETSPWAKFVAREDDEKSMQIMH